MKDLLTYIAIHDWFWILLGALFTFCFVSIFLTACLEKHPVRQYQPGAPEDAGPPSGYFRAMNEAAARHNLLHCGNYLQTRNSSLYRCCISLWLTVDQCTLIMVGGGKLARIDYKRTLFTSQTTDGREIVTMDNFGVVDLSGVRDIDVVYRADFEELVARHSQRLTAVTAPLKTFSPTRAMDQYEDLGRVRAEKMVSLGLAKFLNRTEASWRYTMKGAFKSAYEGYITGMRKAKLQKERANKRRPGS
jgi:hypothetical protein